MSVTPGFELPYPAPTDPPDGAAQIQALASRLDVVLAAFDANVTVAGSNGLETMTTIPDGNEWTPVEAPILVPVTRPGQLIVIGTVRLRHIVASGDPWAQVAVSGPIAGLMSNIAAVSTGTVGGADITTTCPVLALCQVTGPGTITLQREVRHHIASGTGHSAGFFDVAHIYVGQADT